MDAEPTTSSTATTRVLGAIATLESLPSQELSATTIEQVRHWLASPAYAEYHPGICELIEARQWAELTRLFWERLPFGTGGRRGVMAEFGSATVNRRTIAESAWGLAQYVLQYRTEHAAPSGQPRVVIAFDGRHRSPEFADVCASVFAAAGFQVFAYRAPRATPQLSFSVRHLVADCGVMISASHNPPSDNGFKAYWSHGGQVLPPHDAGIIQCVDQADVIPFADKVAAGRTGNWTELDCSLDDAYVAAVARQSRTTSRQVSMLYTPLHGVGESSIPPVLARAGFSKVDVFEPQRAVDGDFPNVPGHLPNPEHAEVLRPAIGWAEIHGHDLVLASDPDADRLAVAVRSPQGRYVCLTGNQLGGLLADFAIRHRRLEVVDPYVLTTLVTTPLIATICRSAGVSVVDDLPVGFKHIGQEMEQRGADRLLFAAEESLGYLAGDYCRDKDAALAALWVAELAAELKEQGLTLLDQLQQLQRQHGWHRESQVSHVFQGPEGAEKMAALIARFRAQPPAALGGAVLFRLRDYGRQAMRYLNAQHPTEPLATYAGELLFADVNYEGVSAQVALRPSGTEPKLKCYFFAQSPAAMPFHEGEQRTLDALKALENGLEQWLRTAL